MLTIETALIFYNYSECTQIIVTSCYQKSLKLMLARRENQGDSQGQKESANRQFKCVAVKSLDINQIIPNLYISDATIAMNKQSLQSIDISSIVVCGQQLKTPFQNIFDYLHLEVKDSVKQNIHEHFDKTFQFIDVALLRGKRVLVHCAFGVSRSSTIVIAYIIRKYLGRYEQCYNLVRNKRVNIKPNQGFVLQLQKYSTYVRENAKAIIQKNNMLKQANK